MNTKFSGGKIREPTHLINRFITWAAGDDDFHGFSNGKRVFHPQDFRMQLSSELLPVCISFAQLLEMHRRLNDALATQVDEMRHEGHILAVTDLLAHVAVVERILNQARPQRMSLSGDWFQQGRLKR